MLTVQAIPHLDGSEIDGIHLLWAPPYPTGHSLNGFAIDRRIADQEDRAHCFKIDDTILDQARRRGFTHIPEATIWAYPQDPNDPGSGRWTYRFELPGRHYWVTARLLGGIAAFAGRGDGQIIAGQAFVADEVRLEGGSIEVLWIIAGSVDVPVEICFEVRDDEGWGNADRIVEGLQMPFQAVHPAVGSEADEEALASDQAVPGVINADWSDVSTYANTALQRPFRQPSWRAVVSRPGGDGDEWDVHPFGLVVAATIVPEWQRALGFAHLDNDGLVPDEVYDYRLTGTVPRSDRDETQFDFHTVPRRYRLPSWFQLGDVDIWCAEPVEVVSETQPSSPVEPLWKGIRFDEPIRLGLSEFATRVILAGSSSGPVDFHGLLGDTVVASMTLPLQERTEVDFGTPVDMIVMVGKGFFAGIVPRPIAAGLDPHEPVEISQVVLGVRFAPTPPPKSPTDVDAVNLGDATRAARRGAPDFNRGFELSWQPPPKIDPVLTTTWWPADATAAPPTDVARYTLERSWSGVPFHGRPDTDGFQVSSRNADPVTDHPEPGFAVLRAFPPANHAGIAGEPIVRAIDVLPDDAPAFGDLVTYQVFSVDAIGRRSGPAVSAPTQLQKLSRPPMPTTPPAKSTPAAGLVPPVGVQVRLLQKDNRDLSVADQVFAQAGDVVVVRWGWGPEEREVDPLVTEFRLYEHDGVLLGVNVEVTGPVSARPGGWAIPCRFDTAVSANQFVGNRAQLNRPFAILSHGAGTVTEVIVKSLSNSAPTAPSGDGFTLNRADGAELDPAHWHRRVSVVPRTTGPLDPDEIESYQAVIPATWIAVSPDTTIQVASIGVSAADAESYVADRRAAVEPSPRVGNESSVAAVEVTARHRGRPNLAIADLGPVESLSSGRRLGNEVYRSFVPADHLPAAASVSNPMRLERISAGKVLPRLVVDDAAINVVGADGSLILWTLSPADAATLRAEYANGPVSNRFLAHVTAQLDGLEAVAEQVGDVDPTASVEDVLPNNPGRWVYRLRAVDRAGKVSVNGQVLQMVLTVPTVSRAVSPELVDIGLAGDQATVTVKHRSSSASELLVFHSVDPRVMPARASLATVRNRPDLGALDVLVVRDDRGQRLIGQVVTANADGIASASFTVPNGNRFHAWAISVSNEGLPSRLIGPLHVTHGVPPEVNT